MDDIITQSPNHVAPIILPGTPRAPFTVTHLPLLAQLYRSASRKRRRVARRFIGKPAKRLFRFAYQTLKLGGMGTAELDTGAGGRRTLHFDVRNTQFGALYIDGVRDGAYEPEVACLIDAFLPDDGTFFDIGSNWGFFSLLAASRPGFRGTVCAFEPFPPTYADLASMVGQAGLEEAVRCFHLALSDREGTADMGIADGVLSGIARIVEGGEGTAVKVAPLDSLDLPAPDVIKMDVEGHEAAALRGARHTLETAKPFIVFENWREPERPAVTLEPFTILAEMGYRFFVPGWRNTRDGVTWIGEHPDASATSGERQLALVEATADQRFLLAQQINFVACHASRLETLIRK